ncbi:MAG: glycosyltransferase family 4 protein [Terriglobia bacterium]
MRILLLNEYFPPDTAATANMAAAVVDVLAERHEVTVLCGRPSYDPTERHPFYLFRRDRRGKAVVARVGSTTFPRFRMRQRIWNYLSFTAIQIPSVMVLKGDVVLAMTDPPFQGIVGAFVAFLKRKPFVYNIRDLYPEMAVLGNIVRPSWWLRLWERLHRWALRRASRVIVLGEDTRERIIAKGIDPARVVVVRDGARPVPRVATPDHPVTHQVRSGFGFVVLHAGNLGFYGAWETVIKSAEMLDHDDAGFVFVGEGAQRAQVEAAARGNSKVKFQPFRPAEQVPYVLAAGDLHLVTIKRGLEGVVVPSKLYSILAAGKPILALAPEGSDVARVVMRAGCGVVVDPDDPAALAAVVQELSHDRERVAKMGNLAFQAAGEFARDKELQRFRQIIEDVA